MRARLILAGLCLVGTAVAQHEHHGHSGMTLDASGMVMSQNPDRLPAGCDAVAGEIRFEVEGGAEFAQARPGNMFGYSQHHFEAAPCSRITVTFHNRDAVRHHWMVHGLPRTLHPGGMFHLEAAGGASQTGTFIAPAENATYLVHCDVAQHMEKGMKGQLVVGAGGDALWAVPGNSAPFLRADYLPWWAAWVMVAALLAAFVAARAWLRRWPGPNRS